MKVGLDTNILVYAEGINDRERHQQALQLIERLSPDDTFVPVHVLGELYNVLTRRGGYSKPYARQRIERWTEAFSVVDTTADGFTTAADLATDHNLTIWDSVVVCSAARAGCRLLLSEDLQDGFNWGGMTVVNPFATATHPLMAALLEGK
ncbi:PIN domain-containing protein [Mesorhizobium sp. ASY16-5R]|uniref:PIN domain-containing protein n=1 Tax=Mesorhizobium sp. ASY16-5R TaxID=3445772 RepID=UPI003F9F994D